MADLSIQINIRGGETAERTLKNIQDVAEKAAVSLSSFQDKAEEILKAFDRPIQDPFRNSTRSVKDYDKALEALNKGIAELNQGMIDSKDFTLLYGKALNDLKSTIKSSYGENREYEQSIKDANEALNKQKSNLNNLKTYFSSNTKALQEQVKEEENLINKQKELDRSYEAVQKGIRDLNNNLIDSVQFANKYGKALANLKSDLKSSFGENERYEQSIDDVNNAINKQKRNLKDVKDYFSSNTKALKDQRKAIEDAQKAQERYNRSLVSDELKRGRKLLEEIRKEEERNINKQKELDKSFDAVNKGIRELNEGLITAEQFTNRYGRALNNLRADVRDSYGENLRYEQSIDDVSEALRRSRREQERSSNSGGTLANTWKTVRAAALGYATVTALMKFPEIIKNIVDVNIQLDSLQRSFKAITGSAESARYEMEFVAETADTLGLELTDLEQSYKNILAASMNTSLEGKEVRGVFLSISKAASVLGMSADDTKGSLRALAQMISKGNVQAEELRGQLGERLPGAFQMAAEAMEVSTEELNDMLERGDVLAVELLPKLAKVLEDRFGKAAVESAMSAQASFNRFKNAVTEVQRSLSESGLLEDLTDLANEAKNFLETNEDLISTNLDSFFKSATAAAKGTLWTISQLASALGYIETIAKGAAEGLYGSIDQSQRALQNYVKFHNQLVSLEKKRQDLSEKNVRDESLEIEISKVKRLTDMWKSNYEYFQVQSNNKKKSLDEEKSKIKEINELLRGDAGREEREKASKAQIDAFLEERSLDKISKDLAKEVKSIQSAYAQKIALAKKYREDLKKETDYEIKLKAARDLEIEKAEKAAMDKRAELLEKGTAKQEKELNKQIKNEEKNINALFKLLSEADKDYKKRLKEVDKDLKYWFKDYDKSVSKASKAQINILEDTSSVNKKLALSDYEYKVYLLQEEVNKRKELGVTEEQLEAYKSIKMKEINKEMYDEMYDDALDFTDRIIDNWDDMGDVLVGMAKEIVADIAKAFITKTIVMPVIMSVQESFGIFTGESVIDSLTGDLGTGAGILGDAAILYNAISGGTSEAIGNYLGSGFIGDIGSSIFGAELWGTAGTTATSAAGIPVGVASPEALAAASTSSSGIVGALSEMALPFALGDLGYSYIGDILGLPQSEYSGLTAGTGAALGSLAGPIGTVAGALLGGLAGSFLGGSEPEPRIGIRKGDISEFGYNPTTKDMSNQDEINDYIIQYYDAYFSAIDELTVNSVADVLSETSWERLRVHPEDFDTVEEALVAVNDLVFEKFSEGFISGLEGGELGEYLDVDFFEDVSLEGESLLDTFIRVGETISETDGFADMFTHRVDELGESSVVAYQNVEMISEAVSSLNEMTGALERSDIATTLSETIVSWELLVGVLEEAKATTDQLLEAEQARNELLGADLTGLSASSIQQQILAGGGISSVISEQINTIASSFIAQEIYTGFISDINEQVGEVFSESGYDLRSVVEYLESIDTSEVQKEIVALQEAFGLLSTNTEEAERIITEALEGQLSASQKFAEWQIDNSSALESYIKILEGGVTSNEIKNSVENFSNLGLSGEQLNTVLSDLVSNFQDVGSATRAVSFAINGQLTASEQFAEWQINNIEALSAFNEITAAGVTQEELEEAVDTFIELGLEGNQLSLVISELADSFTNATDQMLNNISNIEAAQEALTPEQEGQYLQDIEDIYSFFQNPPSLAQIRGDEAVDVFNEEAYKEAFSEYVVSTEFQSILGRQPTTEGMDYWVNELLSGAINFSEINEAIREGITDPGDIVDETFNRLFGRLPSGDYWEQQLAAGDVSLSDLEDAILSGASEEDLAYYLENQGQVEITNWQDFSEFADISEHFNEIGSYLSDLPYSDFMEQVTMTGEFSTSEQEVIDALSMLEDLPKVISDGAVNIDALDEFVQTLITMDPSVIEDIFGADAIQQLNNLNIAINEFESATESAASELEDTIDITSAKRQLEIDILETQGRTEEAIALEREGIIADLNERYQEQAYILIELQEQLWDLQDAAEAVDLSNLLKEFRENLWLEDPLADPSTQMTGLYNEFEKLYSEAMSGDKTSIEELISTADDYLSLSQESLSLLDYKRTAVDISQMIMDVEDYLGGVVTDAGIQTDTGSYFDTGTGEYEDPVTGVTSYISSTTEVIYSLNQEIIALKEQVSELIDVTEEGNEVRKNIYSTTDKWDKTGAPVRSVS